MIHLYDLVRNKPLTNYERKVQLQKIESDLVKGAGPNTKFKFDIGSKVKDVFTYVKPTDVWVVGRYIQNGWNFYTVKDNFRIYNLREKDLTL